VVIEKHSVVEASEGSAGFAACCKLAKATKVAEAPDPVLPSAWGPSARKREPTEDRDTTRTVLDTGLNVLAIAFLVWLVVLVRREK